MNIKVSRRKFNSLPISDQSALVINFGVFMMVKHTKTYTMTLYEIDCFLIAVVYHRKRESIEKICMLSYKELDLFIKDIDVMKMYDGYK